MNSLSNYTPASRRRKQAKRKCATNTVPATLSMRYLREARNALAPFGLAAAFGGGAPTGDQLMDLVTEMVLIDREDQARGGAR